MTIERVLHLLADGAVHSGEELGQALGVSRTAVWKQLKKLEELGTELQVVKGRGYQLENGLELMREELIRHDLTPEASTLLTELELNGSIDSTNNRALERARAGNGHGFVCLAEHQSAGRGRHGRKWVSPYGRNIYLSLAWEFGGGAAVLEGLSLAVGVAIVRALQSAGVDGVELKWPNDVLFQGKKLAGVLLEMNGDAAGPCQVVVGVGINVAMRPSEAKDIEQQWMSLHAIQPELSRNRLIAALLNELLPLLANYQRQGFSHYRQAWEAVNAYKGREVEVRVGEQLSMGTMIGVSDAGALRLATEAGEKTFYGGEASLRRSEKEPS